MIQHYSKVALRNLMKYKTQNLISTIGLAVGLLCFSICFYCSRYMQSVDQCFNNYHRLVDINLQSPNQKIPDRKTKCVIKTHINIKQNVIFCAKLKPV